LVLGIKVPEDVGIKNEMTAEKKRERKQAVPEPTKTRQKKQEVKEEVQEAKGNNQSVVPASVRTEEEKKALHEDPPKKSKPTNYNPSRQETEEQVQTSDKEESRVQFKEDHEQSPPKEESHKSQNSPKVEERSESQLVKDIQEVDKARDSQTNERKEVDKSFTSEKFTAVANDYVGGVLDKVMGDYTEIMVPSRNNNSAINESGVNSSNPPVDQDMSIERRVNMDSSVEQQDSNGPSHRTEVEGHASNNQDEPVSDHNKSTSTTRNMATNYVSNMIEGLY
jgi:hypothetical protein